MHNIERMKRIKETLLSVAEGAIGCGLEKVNVCELGEVVDMIKDLAEAEEKCWKGCYYKRIVEAMDEFKDGELPEEVEMKIHEDVYGKRGYNPHRSSRTGRYMSRSSSSRSRGGMRGYPMPRYDRDADEPPYDDDGNPVMGMDRFGRPYHEYKAMRRSYTETHSDKDKMEMEKHAKEHLDDSISTMKDIWSASDPDLRKKMKNELTSLLATMN